MASPIIIPDDNNYHCREPMNRTSYICVYIGGKMVKQFSSLSAGTPYNIIHINYCMYIIDNIKYICVAYIAFVARHMHTIRVHII